MCYELILKHMYISWIDDILLLIYIIATGSVFVFFYGRKCSWIKKACLSIIALLHGFVCLYIFAIAMLYILPPTERWGNFINMSSRTECDVQYSGRVLAQLVLSDNLPGNYEYYGPLSNTYALELGHEYLSRKEFTVYKNYIIKQRWVNDPFTWGYYKRFYPYAYYGDWLMIYFNNKAGLYVIWGVGPDMDQDITKELLDAVAETGDYKLLEEYQYDRLYNKNGDIYCLHKIQSILEEKERWQYPEKDWNRESWTWIY